MTAARIDGKAVAAKVRGDVAGDVAAFRGAHGVVPTLAVVLVGEDPASQVYVRNKIRQTEEVGMVSIHHRVPATISQGELEALIAGLNRDDAVDGILLQLPLPGGLDANSAIECIDPAKDVDGLTVTSAGYLALGRPGLRPCTPTGCVILAKEALGEDLSGAHCVVVGRSILVGKPAGQLFLNENCTVTLAHSRTRELAEVCRMADILVPAVGRPEMVRGDWVREGATVIDVGINRVPAPEKGEGKTRLVGDVAFEEAVTRAAHITPVPGGVGPMTIACLLQNTLVAAKRRRGLS